MSCCIECISAKENFREYEIRLGEETQCFSLKDKEALLLGKELRSASFHDPVEINGKVSFNPAQERLLIDVDSIVDWSAFPFAGFVEKVDVNKGAYGIYCVPFGDGVIHIELYPAKKVACKGSLAEYGKSSPLCVFKKCEAYFRSMAAELMEKSALYVYGIKGTARIEGLDFVMNKNRMSDFLTDYIFFIIHAEKIEKALERLTKNPHRLLMREYSIERLEKIRRVDCRSIRNFYARPIDLQEKEKDDGKKSYYPRRMEQLRYIETFNTLENRFVVFVAKEFSKRLFSVLQWLNETDHENLHLKKLDRLKKHLFSFLNTVPFAGINRDILQERFPFRSKVFSERQGYIQIARMWRTFERGEPFLKNLTNIFALRRYSDIFELLCYFRVIQEEEQKKVGIAGTFYFSGEGASAEKIRWKQEEYQSLESGLNYGCRYELGNEKAVLYNYPIERDCKKLEIGKKVESYKSGHLRPDILVLEKKEQGLWKIDRLVDAKFRNHSLGEESFEKGCEEIQKYFWLISDNLWPQFTAKKAEGRFISGDSDDPLTFCTTITLSDKTQMERSLTTAVESFTQKNIDN
ncbi:MAG: DUF2357 domain-containing protein [Bacteroidia bacterium]|nr:DUF2357 domain-containing protein [Bacteroidia bacterium]